MRVLSIIGQFVFIIVGAFCLVLGLENIMVEGDLLTTVMLLVSCFGLWGIIAALESLNTKGA